MKKALPSIDDFTDYVNASLKQNSTVYSQITIVGEGAKGHSLSDLLKKSKGRDKMCALIQYTAGLGLQCVNNTNLPETMEWAKTEEGLAFCKTAKSVYNSMSKGRKVFRFLAFYDEIGSMQSVWKKSHPLFVRLLLFLSHFCSFGYFLLDNLVWASSIGLISKFIAGVKWKSSKDSFSLARIIFETTASFFILFNKRRIEQMLEKLVSQDTNEEKIRKSSENYYFLSKLLHIRRQKRFKRLECMQNFMRMIMLLYSLKKSVRPYINPIVIELFGIITSAISIWKILNKVSKGMVLKHRPAHSTETQVISTLSVTEQEEKKLGKLRRNSTIDENMQVMERCVTYDESVIEEKARGGRPTVQGPIKLETDQVGEIASV